MTTVHPCARAKTWILAASLFASAACRGPASDPKEVTSAEAVSTPAAATTTAAASDEAARLRASVAAIVRHCEIERDSCVVQRCAHDEDQALQAELDAGTLRRASILDAWSELLRDDAAPEATVAAYLVGPRLQTLELDGAAPEVSTSTAQGLIERLSGLTRCRANRAAVGITHAAAAAGKLPALIEAVARHPEAPALEPLVLRSMARYARLDALPLLDRALQVAASPRHAAAAVAGPRALVNARPEETQVLCRWTQDQLGHPLPSVRAEASRTLVWCGGPFADAILEQVGAWIDTHELDKNLPSALSGLCPAVRPRDDAGSSAGGAPPEGEARRCDALLSLLERATRDAAMAPDARARALNSRALLRPDETARALAQGLSRAPEEHLRMQAASVLKRMDATSGP